LLNNKWIFVHFSFAVKQQCAHQSGNNPFLSAFTPRKHDRKNFSLISGCFLDQIALDSAKFIFR